MKRAFSFSIFVIGFTAMASQIVFVRELLVVFYGNELSIGFILASWLAGGAIGSGLLGRFADRARSKIDLFTACQIILAILLPLVILAIRMVRPFLHINPGEIMALSPIVITSFIILAPVCVLLGFSFALACRIYDSSQSSRAVKIGRVYVLEAAGATAGGLGASFILIRFFDTFQVMGILSLLNISSSLVMPIVFKEFKSRTLFLAASNIIFAALILMWPFKLWDGLKTYSLAKEWHGQELVSSRNSVYGNIAVTKRDGSFSFFDNGLHLYTIPDRQTAEEAVHFALLEHPRPKDVLLIGGGVGGLAGEIIKHPIEKVDYVELDPLIIRMAKDYLPAAYYSPLEDPKVSIINLDGRFFVKKTPRRYDCVIIHVGDPQTAQINRFYTVEFFRELKAVLRDGGVVSFAVTSSEDYINTELKDFLRSLYATLSAVFPDVLVIPGNIAHFLASGQAGMLTYDYNILMERAGERRLDLKYVREYYLFSRLSPQRLSYIEGVMAGSPAIRMNYDFRPSAYYYDMIFWTAHFRDSFFKGVFKAVTDSGIRAAVLCVSIFIVLLGLAVMRRKMDFSNAVLATLGVSGFSMMAFQIIILLAFQIIYGYLFYKLGIILTSFMIGLVVGGRYAVKIIPRLKRCEREFILAQCAVTVYPLLLPIVFPWLSNSRDVAVSWLGSNVLFLILPAAAGFIGGIQFPLANKIYIDGKRGSGEAGGITYGIDLAGSSLGAILTGAFLMPVLGVFTACLAISAVNFAVLLTLVLGMKNIENRH